MANENPKKVDLLLAEIDEAERKRAAAAMQDTAFVDWVSDFRYKFIVNGFLKTMYAIGGRFSIGELRVARFGDYILPRAMEGTVFHETPKAYIEDEERRFRWYLTMGQSYAVPEKYRIADIPAKLVRQEIFTIAERLKLFGEAGGGILIAPKDLNADCLPRDKSDIAWDESEESYMELWKWIAKFDLHNQRKQNLPVEIRPPWHHLANYAFFNVPVNRLPIFGALLNAKGQVDKISFPSTDLSNRAREYVASELFKRLENLKKHTEAFSVTKEHRDMTCWIWNNVGCRKWNKTLSYQEIADLTGEQKSTIGTWISRFDKRLENKLDRILLGQLLQKSVKLGLDANQTYQVLAERKLVRKREIDSFVDFFRLI